MPPRKEYYGIAPMHKPKMDKRLEIAKEQGIMSRIKAIHAKARNNGISTSDILVACVAAGFTKEQTKGILIDLFLKQGFSIEKAKQIAEQRLTLWDNAEKVIRARLKTRNQKKH